MTRRSDYHTEKAVEGEKYVDFPASFDCNPMTGALAKITDEEAVKTSLRNLIYTVVGEKPFDEMDVGSKVHHLEFDQPSDFMMDAIEETIAHTISTYEPRVQLQSVRAANLLPRGHKSGPGRAQNWLGQTPTLTMDETSTSGGGAGKYHNDSPYTVTVIIVFTLVGRTDPITLDLIIRRVR
jgi:phage baseplate assembly protein W